PAPPPGWRRLCRSAPLRSPAASPPATARRARSARTACPSTAPCRYSFLEFLNHARHDLEQIAHDAVVGDLEDRRFLVLVDGDDAAADLHAVRGLDRARE